MFGLIVFGLTKCWIDPMDIIQVRKRKREVKDEVELSEAEARASAFLVGEIIDLDPSVEEAQQAVKEEAQEFAEELNESYGNCLGIGTSSAAGNILKKTYNVCST